ncbi:hypothetical protein, partial [Methyloglobulus sp.]|uniref:hypothetical protein n=1 Tax=Methyloglobulus sp. TaxID=2518622 RepID=UPI0032B746DC
FSRIPPIKVNANSKKSAFDQSAGVSAVCAKVSGCFEKSKTHLLSSRQMHLVLRVRPKTSF